MKLYNLEHVMAEEQQKRKVWKLVLTGGPCGGKTTGQARYFQLTMHRSKVPLVSFDQQTGASHSVHCSFWCFNMFFPSQVGKKKRPFKKVRKNTYFLQESTSIWVSTNI